MHLIRSRSTVSALISTVRHRTGIMPQIIRSRLEKVSMPYLYRLSKGLRP